MDHGQFKVTLKTVDKKFAYTICRLELTNMEVCMYMHGVCARRTGACEESGIMYILSVYVCRYVHVCTYLTCAVYSVVGWLG